MRQWRFCSLKQEHTLLALNWTRSLTIASSLKDATSSMHMGALTTSDRLGSTRQSLLAQAILLERRTGRIWLNRNKTKKSRETSWRPSTGFIADKFIINWLYLERRPLRRLRREVTIKPLHKRSRSNRKLNLRKISLFQLLHFQLSI